MIGDKSLWHIPPKYLPDYNKDYDNKINFIVVRNPYTRIISEFKYRNRKKKNIIINKNNLNKFVKNIPSFYYKNKFSYGCHFLPQSEFLYKNTKIINIENLDNEFSSLLKAHNYPNIKLNKDNKSVDGLNVNDLDKDSIKIINKIYNDDFTNFSYKKILV